MEEEKNFFFERPYNRLGFPIKTIKLDYGKIFGQLDVVVLSNHLRNGLQDKLELRKNKNSLLLIDGLNKDVVDNAHLGASRQFGLTKKRKKNVFFPLKRA